MDCANGIFNDGSRLGRIPVAVALGSKSLEIRDGDGHWLRAWPYDGLRLVDEPRDGARRLAFAGDDARLTLMDAALLDAIAQRSPRLRSSGRAGTTQRARDAARWALAVAAVAMTMWLAVPRWADAIALWLPMAWEERYGRHWFAAWFGNDALCTTPEGEAALNRLTRRLAAGIAGDARFTVRVARGPVDNAFAGPGGQIVIYEGLIAAAGSAEEVAAVLAHEIGHVVQRHAARSLVRELGLDFIVTLLFGDLELGSVGWELLNLRYSRDFEREADARALSLLAAAGIDSRGEVEAFERAQLDEAIRGRIHPLLSTHPPTAERRRTAERHGAPGGPAMSAADWAALKAICRPKRNAGQGR